MDKPQHFWRSRSPATRLAAGYVLILMFISLVFSGWLYRLSVNELADGLRHEYARIKSFGSDLVVLADPEPSVDVLKEAKQHLVVELVYFNSVILVLGSVVSYRLAKRTLRPIEEALESQSRFTADASHELRTPLTAMQTEIEVALRDPSLNKPAKKLLNSNLEEVAKLKALSDNLLRLANKNDLNLGRSVSLLQVTREACNRYAKPAKANRIKITNKVSDLQVPGDYDSLVELAVTLLDNALKYSPAGSTITISSSRHGKQAYLVVADQGQGIRVADQPHIFDRFYRADSSRSKDTTEGHGLGLSIAQKIASLHGGEITVKSTPGKGSTFTVKLPLGSV